MMTIKTINTPPRGAFQTIDPNKGTLTPLRGKIPSKTIPEKGKEDSQASMAAGSSSITPQRVHAIDISHGNVMSMKTKDPAKGKAVEPSKDEMKARFHAVCRERVGEYVEGDIEDSVIQEWTVDDFEFVKKLGMGGSANVFCAREVQSGYQVALKVQEEDEDGLCEIDIHLSLEHTNIVRMIDYFFSDSSFHPEFEDEELNNCSKRYLYIIMELCDGGSLHDFIGESYSCCLSEKLAATLFKNALDAVEYLHERNIIHCDCKPANFLVHRGQLMLADFGMAVHEDEKEIIGATPVYMAPEHLLAWRHMTNNFDKRSDIYSLGVVLYEMILGYLPFEVIEAEDSTIKVSHSKKEMRESSKSLSTEVILKSLPKMTLDDDDFETPVLDLRKLNDQSEDEPFYIPPPIFPLDVSEEAQDLILKLMEPSLKKRISISDAKNHPWFQKQLEST